MSPTSRYDKDTHTVINNSEPYNFSTTTPEPYIYTRPPFIVEQWRQLHITMYFFIALASVVVSALLGFTLFKAVLKFEKHQQAKSENEDPLLVSTKQSPHEEEPAKDDHKGDISEATRRHNSYSSPSQIKPTEPPKAVEEEVNSTSNANGVAKTQRYSSTRLFSF